MRRVLSSIKLTVGLLLVLAVLSILGTVIPQGVSPHEYARAYGKTAAKIILALNLNDMYHSTWFRFLLLLFSINLILCSLERIPGVLRSLKKRRLLTKKEIEKFPNSQKAPKDKLGSIEKAFGRPTMEKGGLLFFEKGRIGPLGPYITHLGILVILIGGLIGSFLGFRGVTEIPEGERTNTIVVTKGVRQERKTLPFYIRCLDFSVSFYPGSRVPKEYKTVAAIEDKSGKVLEKKEIKVNHPLKFMGYTIYQASYGMMAEGSFKIGVMSSDGKVVKKVEARMGEKVKVAPGKEIKIVSFQPNLQGFGKAVHIVYYENGMPKDAFWIFRRFPGFDMERKRGLHFSLEDVKTKYYTGLEVSRSPGVNLVWLGSIIMVLGIFISFFVPHRKVWVAIDKGKLYAAGTSTKNQESLDEALANILKEKKI